VVGTVMSNWGLEEFLLDRGLRLSRARVGDRFVADRMLRDGANLGGEPSGHTIFFDRLVTGDGLLTAIQVMSLMAESGRPLSNLAACMQRYPQVLLSIPVKDKPPLERVPGVRRAIGRVERILGKRGRMLVRYSGTEPVCRVMIEGDDERSIHRLADEIASAVKREIGARRPA
jgi:phosphoglucosamine mutase